MVAAWIKTLLMMSAHHQRFLQEGCTVKEVITDDKCRPYHNALQLGISFPGKDLVKKPGQLLDPSNQNLLELPKDPLTDQRIWHGEVGYFKTGPSWSWDWTCAWHTERARIVDANLILTGWSGENVQWIGYNCPNPTTPPPCPLCVTGPMALQNHNLLNKFYTKEFQRSVWYGNVIWGFEYGRRRAEEQELPELTYGMEDHLIPENSAEDSQEETCEFGYNSKLECCSSTGMFTRRDGSFDLCCKGPEDCTLNFIAENAAALAGLDMENALIAPAKAPGTEDSSAEEN